MAMVDFRTPGGRVGMAYLAEPKVSGPGVLVLHAWWGLNPFFQQFCDRLAGEGFVALAPDLCGSGSAVATIEEAKQNLSKMDDAATYDRIQGAITLLQNHPKRTGEKLAAVGFSMGGSWALSLDGPVSAIVTFYGLNDPKCVSAAGPFLGHFAETDEWEPMAQVKEFQAEIQASGRTVTFHIYPGAQHWFFEGDRPEYDAEAAALAFARTVEFLRSLP